MRILCCDDEVAAVGHGVACIDDEIEDRVLELVLVAQGGPEVTGQLQFEPDAFAEGAPEQLLHRRDQRINLERLGVERLAPRECE